MELVSRDECNLEISSCSLLVETKVDEAPTDGLVVRPDDSDVVHD